VPPTLRQEIKTSDEVRLMSYDLRSWWFIAVNVHKGPLADKRVRQALNYALDRATLAELTVGADPETEDKNRPSEFVTGPFIKSSPY